MSVWCVCFGGCHVKLIYSYWLDLGIFYDFNAFSCLHIPGLIDVNSDHINNQGASVMSQLNKNDLDILSDIFTSSSTSSALACSSGSADIVSCSSFKCTSLPEGFET